MAHFVPFGDGYLNLDKIDRVLIFGPDGSEQGRHLIVAERHERPNTILGEAASKEHAHAMVRDLLGDAIHDE